MGHIQYLQHLEDETFFTGVFAWGAKSLIKDKVAFTGKGWASFSCETVLPFSAKHQTLNTEFHHKYKVVHNFLRYEMQGIVWNNNFSRAVFRQLGDSAKLGMRLWSSSRRWNLKMKIFTNTINHLPWGCTNIWSATKCFVSDLADLKSSTRLFCQNLDSLYLIYSNLTRITPGPKCRSDLQHNWKTVFFNAM